MKIINTSNKPFEFTYDGGHFGPYKPGQIVDLPDDMAQHALRKSQIREQDLNDLNVGEIVGYQMEPLDNVAPEKRREIITYSCPFVESGLCDEKPFKKMEDLKVHLDEAHWALLGGKPPVVNQGKPAASPTK